MAALSKISRRAKLYQRIRTEGFPWVGCEGGKNGKPKPHAGAFQFGVRYTFDGERKLETFKTLDDTDEDAVFIPFRRLNLPKRPDAIFLKQIATAARVLGNGAGEDSAAETF